MDKNKVVKPNSLLSARDGLKTHEHKILALAVSKVDSFADELNPVTISFKEFQGLSGQHEKNYQSFYRICRSIGSKTLQIQQDTHNWDLYSWVSKIECRGGDVTFKWSPDIQPLLIEIKSRFKELELETYFSFSKDYTAGFYELLKAQEHHANNPKGLFWVELEVAEIREKFQLGQKYKHYKDLKRRVVIDSLNEIAEKTDLKFIDIEERGRPTHTIKLIMVKTRPRSKKEVGVLGEQISWIENEKGVAQPIIHRSSSKKVKKKSKGMATEKQIQWVKDICNSNKNIITPDFNKLTADQANEIIKTYGKN